jgi:hypothetical protein
LSREACLKAQNLKRNHSMIALRPQKQVPCMMGIVLFETALSVHTVVPFRPVRQLKDLVSEGYLY